MDILPGSEEAAPPSPYADWMADFAARGLVACFLVVAIPCGVAFGLLTGVRDLSLGLGLESGIFFGLLMGVWLTALSASRMRPLRALSAGDRRQVVAVVRRGSSAFPPHLAPAVKTYVEIVRRAYSRPTSTERTKKLLIVLAVLAPLGVLSNPRPGELVVDVAILALLLRRALSLNKRRDRVLANAYLAERAASALVTAGA